MNEPSQDASGKGGSSSIPSITSWLLSLEMARLAGDVSRMHTAQFQLAARGVSIIYGLPPAGKGASNAR